MASPAPDAQEITRLLRDSARGDAGAREQVTTLLYGQLLRLARGQRSRHGAGETLSTTVLVQETYLRLVDAMPEGFADRAHFFRVAARAMRNVLVDDARRHRAAKRGGGSASALIEEAVETAVLPGLRAEEVMAVHRALERLEALDERQARVVELRYFAGLEVAETAEALGISSATVKRDWTMARAWLVRELEQNGSGGMSHGDPGLRSSS